MTKKLTVAVPADPGAVDRKQRFAKHFFDELKNQVRGKPTELPHEPPRK